MPIRINKYLASLGIASRRAVDKMIKSNQIKVNGKLAVPGQKIDPIKDQIVVNDKIIDTKPEKFEYIILNKPRGCVSTTDDPKGQKTVIDLVQSKNRLYPVGRLDQDSQGLILLTNDGDLTYRLTHPKHHIPKTYHVTVLGKVRSDQLSKLQSGIKLEDGTTKPAKVKIIKENYPKNTILEIVLHEGKKRQIRRMCSSLHLFVKKLERLSIGPIKLGGLNLGKSRPLTEIELKQLIQI